MSRNLVVMGALLGAGALLGGLYVGCSQPEEPAPTQAPAPAVAPSVAPAPAGAELPVPVVPTTRKKTPHPSPSSPDVQVALELLKGIVADHATDAENPWAVAHGMLALGPDITLTNGKPAVDHLYERFADMAEVQGHDLPAFPRREGAILVEPHTDLILKAFTEAGVDPNRVVKVDGQDVEVGDHWHHSMLTTFLSKTDGSSSYDSPNDMPWGVQALSAWGQPGMSWTSFEGTQMTLDDLARLMVHVLTSESAFMLRAMAANQGFQKQGQGIFKYTCGGAHLLQGSIYVVARGYGGKAEREKIQVQGRLLFYRLPRELALYQQMLAQHPDRKLILYAQQLKFVGHWLESVHKLMAADLYSPSSSEQKVLAEAVGVLVQTVAELKGVGALDNLDTLREQNEQLYLDLVGDSAHAVRGLELALGVGEFVY